VRQLVVVATAAASAAAASARTHARSSSSSSSSWLGRRQSRAKGCGAVQKCDNELFGRGVAALGRPLLRRMSVAVRVKGHVGVDCGKVVVMVGEEGV
jgi:hypothetical protein